MKEIPIQNIYYLLCYAWDNLEERDLVNVQTQDFKDLPNLFARVLVHGLKYLFKKGLDRNYVSDECEYHGIKGKLLLAASIKENTFVKGKAYCSFDEFSYDVLHNRILKATVQLLLKYRKLDPAIREELVTIKSRFRDVSDMHLRRSDFSKVILHRNNQYYKFLLNVSLVIFENLLFDEQEGAWVFRDFLRDEDKMARLFEKFILNFYRRELKGEYEVGVEIIKWQAEAIGDSSLSYLPSMKTDISLTSADRKIIIDAKYYKEAMVTHFDTEKFRSAHSYQMYAYMSNAVQNSDTHRSIEGVLLYPTVEKSFVQMFKVKDYRLTFRTINLAGSWQEIDRTLRDIVFSNNA